MFISPSAKDDRDDLLVYKSIDFSRLERIKIFGIPVDNLSRDEAVACILKALENKGKGMHVLFLDPVKLLRLRLKRHLRPIATAANLILADGGGLTWAAQNLGTPLKERIPMISLIMDIMRLAARNDFTVYLLGSRSEYLEKVFFNFQRSFPGLRIVGRQNGYFGQKREELVKESLRKSSPDIILLSMEFPDQELWIRENRKYLSNSVLLGVDNAFAILSGMKRGTPNWFQIRGLNWLWHTSTHPWLVNHLCLVFGFYLFSILFSAKTSKKDKDKKTKIKK